jgi:hypothetical protein
MELMAEFMSVVGALVLSVSCGVLVEEMLIGGLVRLILARQPETMAKKERSSGEDPGEPARLSAKTCQGV